MSSYFDFIVERNIKDKWKCVAKSNYDDSDIINPYILKRAFWDADFSEDINNLKNISDETFLEFSEKIELESFDGYALINVNNPWNVEHALYEMSKDVRYKNNDVCLCLSLSTIMDNKEFLSKVAYFKTDDVKELIDKAKEIREADTLDKLISLIKETENVIFDSSSLIKIIFHDSPYAILQNIKYVDLYKINFVEVYSVSYGIKQYVLNGKVSYAKDVECMIHEIDKTLDRYENLKKADNLAKTYVADILYELENDEKENSTKLYKRLSEYCADSEMYDSDEIEDLESQKEELNLLLKFIGENGRLIWKIE